MCSQFIALRFGPKSGGRSGARGKRSLASRILYLCAIGSLLSSPVMPQDAGEIFNNACRTCHTTREGDDRLGPNLHNIIGRKAGSLPHYNYSSAMKEAGFIWDEERLERFIARPDEVVPGNNMKPYGGLASAEERTKVLDYLRSAARP